MKKPLWDVGDVRKQQQDKKQEAAAEERVLNPMIIHDKMRKN
jgi:hypothetical protein